MNSTSFEALVTEALRGRTRTLREGALEAGPIVYWMSRALRVEDNPAFDVAVELARSLKRPLALYAELSTLRDPYASARHWTFELEGLSELREVLESRGIPFTFYVEQEHQPQSLLERVTKHAGLLVIEHLPVASERRFATTLVTHSTLPIVAVDASCVVPMNQSRKATRRAFVFRDKFKDLMMAAVRGGAPAATSLEGLVFESLDKVLPEPFRDRVPIREILSKAPIDHQVGPIAETRGGRRAGLQRWERFKSSGGLRAYAKRRNDALVDGVSRMSAYLHYGFVSAFELARDAQQSEKYVDELLVWRELAWHYCDQVPEHDHATCLPSWALESLESHQDDPRQLETWNDLWTGSTGDPLWDACQASLWEHGELHNNLRMTWGKRIVEWTREPQEMLDRLCELNHRLALDGNDPASYGGLLWCLGEFDRPFKPERAVWGVVRDRPIDVHARRCPPDRFLQRIQDTNVYRQATIGIIGAGVSGIAAATTLAYHGVKVTLWDKGYRPGGRVARRSFADAGVEHGTSSFTIDGTGLDSRRFLELCRGWTSSGILAEELSGPRFGGGGDLQGWLRTLSADLEVHQKVSVGSIERDSHWVNVVNGSESLGNFHAVIGTAPAPQMLAFAGEELRAEMHPLESVTYSPSWVVIAHWPDDKAPEQAFLASLMGGSTFTEQPGETGFSSWAIEASPAWSREQLEWTKEEVVSHCLQQCESAGIEHPHEIWSHRWRFSRADEPLGSAFWRSECGRVFWTGDAALGGGVQGAWRAGQRTATAVLSALRESLLKG